MVTYDHLTIGICLASLDQRAPTKLLIQTDLKTVLCVCVWGGGVYKDNNTFKNLSSQVDVFSKLECCC